MNESTAIIVLPADGATAKAIARMATQGVLIVTSATTTNENPSDFERQYLKELEHPCHDELLAEENRCRNIEWREGRKNHRYRKSKWGVGG